MSNTELQKENTSQSLIKEIQALIKFLNEKGLKQKESVCYDKRITYFRGTSNLFSQTLYDR